MKPAKILFFVKGNAPTAEDFLNASQIKAQVVFRNASAVPSEQHSLEICDGVAGCVPPIYASAFPTAEEAVAEKDEALKKLVAKVGDTAPPKRAAKAEGKAEPVEAPKAQVWNPNPTL
jgi:hypothetical protein